MTSHAKSRDSHVAVIGAGNMGSGIAQKYATHGYSVTIVDQNDQRLNLCQQSINAMLKQGVERGVFSESEAQTIFGRIRFTMSLNDCQDASLVVEAIFEDLAAKRDLFSQLDKVCLKDTILATNTSSFKVSDLQIGLRHQERVLGLHYFYHPAKNRLVELIGTKATDSAMLERAQRMQESINKIVIQSKDSPGFIVNRYFVPWLNEAMRMVDEKFSNIPTVEAASKNFFKIGMGPFELMNVTGLPITLHACKALAKSLGDFYAPCPLIVSQLETGSIWDLSGPIETKKLDHVAMRLLLVVSKINCQMVLEENVCTIADSDLGARVGLLWHKGPFELLNDHLSPDLAAELATMNRAYPSFFVPNKLDEHVTKTRPFPCSNILVDRVDSIAIIKFNKPDTLNALDVNLKNDLLSTFFALADDESVDGLVITGHRRAFMAGADLSFFNQNLADDRIDNIIDFAKSAQDLFLAIDQCKKPVVAAISGTALGGGLELALACDAIIATPMASLGFPETGIGIYPGLGGTQRTPLRVGIPLARFLILTGTILSGREAQTMGLVDEIAPEHELVARAIALAKDMGTKTTKTKSIKAPNEYQDLTDAFLKPLDGSASSKACPTTTERAQKALERLAKKAPLAIKTADFLITQANASALLEGLKLETRYLEAIFKSADAKTGLTAALTKQKVNFSGK